MPASIVPGGKIFVFTGIIPIAANDDGLATVIGHGMSGACVISLHSGRLTKSADHPAEIAHQVQRHSAEKISGAKVFSALVILLQILGLDVGLSRLGLTLLMSLPNSRAMESEGEQTRTGKSSTIELD